MNRGFAGDHAISFCAVNGDGVPVQTPWPLGSDHPAHFFSISTDSRGRVKPFFKRTLLCRNRSVHYIGVFFLKLRGHTKRFEKVLIYDIWTVFKLFPWNFIRPTTDYHIENRPGTKYFFCRPRLERGPCSQPMTRSPIPSLCPSHDLFLSLDQTYLRVFSDNHSAFEKITKAGKPS